MAERIPNSKSSDSPASTCCSDTRPKFEQRLPTLSRHRGDLTGQLLVGLIVPATAGKRSTSAEGRCVPRYAAVIWFWEAGIGWDAGDGVCIARPMPDLR